ncbi:PadR family transcriptional regulator [Pelotomaculum isophthalicicum JI]|uniref:PadR family transcriptional regulator n=1 Tax=Pelotomaculum isophthalicicum JI TaxID=947010 RepID=A0A9X4JWQ9_9FIRM|nr:PadR family transcriptional regulator [Pelotomaculum isophthalicicum]MDF9409703.1 PadR family transcriptional regulator [Pelotomaculum isophthalicicum JI]
MREKTDDQETLMRLIIGLYILKILQQGPAHGNKLATEIKRRTKDIYTPNTNALYPLLRTMEERGYICGEWDNPVTRGKRVYTIKDAGVARIPALESMMEDKLKQAERWITILRTDLLGH